MDSLTEQEIRGRLASYLAGRLSLREFHRWLIPLLWTINRQDDPIAFRKASKIALYMAEYGAGHRTEQDLRGLFGPLVLAPPTHEEHSTQLVTVPGMPTTWDWPTQISPAQVAGWSGRVQTVVVDRGLQAA